MAAWPLAVAGVSLGDACHLGTSAGSGAGDAHRAGGKACGPVEFRGEGGVLDVFHGTFGIKA